MNPEVKAFFRRMPGRTIARPWLALHTVVPRREGDEYWFDVISGRSGETYKVRVFEGGGRRAECPCKGARASTAPCTHVLAIIEWAEEQQYQEAMS